MMSNLQKQVHSTFYNQRWAFSLIYLDAERIYYFRILIRTELKIIMKKIFSVENKR